MREAKGKPRYGLPGRALSAGLPGPALAEEGRLSLDGNVSSYLPEWDDARVEVIGGEGGNARARARRPISVRDLLCHTSGLSYGFASSSQEGRSTLQYNVT